MMEDSGDNNLEDQMDELEALRSIYEELVELNPQSFDIPLYSDVSRRGATLQVSFPSNYPASEPPMFSVLADWMSRADWDNLKPELDTICMRELGNPVIYSLAEAVNDWLDFQLPQDDKHPNRASSITMATTSVSLPVIHSGEQIVKMKSRFIPYLAEVSSTEEAERVLHFLMQDKKISVASHCVVAYRVTQKSGDVAEFRQDDGENGAGDTVLRVLRKMNVTNVVVLICRWCGGRKLHNNRFRIYSKSTQELAKKIKWLTLDT